MRIAFFIVGCLLFLAGVTIIYWPVALVCLGLFIAVGAARWVEAPVPTKHVSAPDFNHN